MSLKGESSVASQDREKALEFFAGGGEVAQLMREFDWTSTPLGDPEAWPQSLKTAVRIILTSRFSMWLGWGPDLNFFYNDAYRHDTLSMKHPWALGKKTAEVWAEVWSDLEPRLKIVRDEGMATWDEALMLFLERSGYVEETYHTFSYSPLADDDGSIAGMLCVVTEETSRVVGERRLGLLRDLAEQISAGSTESDLLSAIKHSLERTPFDVPFSLIYLFDESLSQAELAGSSGLGDEIDAVAKQIGLEDDSIWDLNSIAHSGKPVLIEDLSSRFRSVPKGPWDQPANSAVAISIPQPGTNESAGVMIIGLSPLRPFDAEYQGFVDLLIGQIASGLARARSFESERRRAEELARLDRAKTTFFSNVSHELRTPLTLMLGPLEDLLRSNSSEVDVDRSRLEIAHRNSLRLLKLVNTLLDFSRIEAGRFQANYQRLDLCALTSEISSSFQSAAEQARLTLTIDCPTVSQPVYIDRDMWEKVVLNLLSNALKHTFEGGIAVRVREVGETVILTVSDTGTGIPASALPRLFERFYRVEGAVGRTHEGTGIGLSLVQELVKLHGGHVTVESELDRGTTFTIEIPTGKEHLPQDRVSLHETQPGVGPNELYLGEARHWFVEGSSEGGGANESETKVPSATVYIADDNADLRQYLTSILDDRYFVEAFGNGADALIASRRTPPDLILTDVMMPVLDGFGLLAEVRGDETLREIPVIMLSARAGEEAKVDGLELGADDYLIKPFSARELRARVKSNIELARLRKLAAIREEKLRTLAEEAYQELKFFAESLPIMVAERDASGRLKWANARYYQYTGIQPGEFPSDVGSDSYHPDDREPYDAAWAEAFELGKDFTIEVRIRRHDGVLRWWLVTVTCVLNGDKVDRFYISATDIHEQKEAEHALEDRVQQRTAELVEANRELEGFTYTVSHDLRSPLRSIIFNSALLLEQLRENLDDDQRLLLERQMRSARKLATIIDDLLKLSRVSRQEMVVEPVDLSAVANEVVEQLTKDIPRPIDVRIEPDLQAIGDPQLLHFVFLNLIENAVKFSPGGKEIEVGRTERNSRPTFFVRDHGIGFEPRYADKVFQPFERLVTEESFPGTGIGLANVKRIVERHHGKVWAESQVGEGTTFFFTLGAQAPHSESPK